MSCFNHLQFIIIKQYDCEAVTINNYFARNYLLQHHFPMRGYEKRYFIQTWMYKYAMKLLIIIYKCDTLDIIFANTYICV